MASGNGQDLPFIAGGGIGGLAAAYALAREGFRCGCSSRRPNSARSAPASSSDPTSSARSRRSASRTRCWSTPGSPAARNAWCALGQVVTRIPIGERFLERFGNPYAVTHRADIHGSLLDGCKSLPELIELRTSTRVTGFDQDGSSVRVRTEKETIDGIALVGADGGRSVIREKIVGDPLPPVTGHMCYRAVLEDRRGAEGPAPAGGDALGGTQHAHRALPAARLEALQPGRHGDRQAHQRRPQRARHAGRGAAAVFALLRQADQADAHAEGVPALDAALPPAGGQLGAGTRRAARRRRALHAAVHGAGRGDGDGGRGDAGREGRRDPR